MNVYSVALSAAIKNVLDTDAISVYVSQRNDVVAFCIKTDNAPSLLLVESILQLYKQSLITQVIYLLRSDTLLYKQPELWQYPMCITPENFKYIYLCDKEKEESEQYGGFAKAFNQLGFVGVFCEMGS